MGEEKVSIDFDTYGSPIEPEEKKEGFLKKLWNKTIFPDMIKAKRAERAWKEKIQAEAREEVKEEMKDEYVKHYKQMEMDKLKGKKKGGKILGKIGDEFKAMGEAAGKKDIGAMMGMGGGMNTDPGKIMGTGQGSGEKKDVASGMGVGSTGLTNEKIAGMFSLGEKKEEKVEEEKPKRKKKRKGKKVKKVQEVQQESPEDKIKRLLS